MELHFVERLFSLHHWDWIEGGGTANACQKITNKLRKIVTWTMVVAIKNTSVGRFVRFGVVGVEEITHDSQVSSSSNWVNDGAIYLNWTLDVGKIWKKVTCVWLVIWAVSVICKWRFWEGGLMFMEGVQKKRLGICEHYWRWSDKCHCIVPEQFVSLTIQIMFTFFLSLGKI